MSTENIYRKKYIKYKEKYINLKKIENKENIFGGLPDNKINFGDCIGNSEYDIDIQNFTFVAFSIKSPFSFIIVPLQKEKLINLKKEKEKEKIIFKYSSDIQITFTFEFIKNLTKEELFDIKNKYKINLSPDEDKYIVKYYVKDKLRCILTFNSKINFLENIILIESLDTKIKNFYFNDTMNNIFLEGSFSITNKVSDKNIKLSLKKINSIDLFHLDSHLNQLDLAIENKDNYYEIFGGGSEEQTKFNFETYYDVNIKKMKICNDSNLLIKNFSSSIVNLLYVKFDFIKILVNKYPNIFKNIISEILQLNKPNINSNCSNDSDRQFLLTNILKKLNTFIQDDIEITVNKRSGEIFVPVSDITNIKSGKPFKVILDSGNSNTTIIGTNFARALGYIPVKSVKIFSKGVNEGKKEDTYKEDTYKEDTYKEEDLSTILDEKINFKIRFINSNIDIGKTYWIEAYINPKFDEDSLLIGNFDDSLTKIFSTSYCIGYEYSRSNYAINKSIGTIDLDQLQRIITEINNFYTSENYKSVDKKIILENKNLLKNFIRLLHNFTGSKKFLSIEEKNKYDIIYPQLLEIKNYIDLILTDNSDMINNREELNQIKGIMKIYI
jgi:hypothetical protein